MSSTTNPGFDPGGMDAWRMMVLGGTLGGADMFDTEAVPETRS